MLSYQHAYHAGNLADVHKHQALSALLDYLVKKDKPLTYIETHAGRGLYNLTSSESLKTNEAKAGIEKIITQPKNPKDKAYWTIVETIKKTYGKDFYPGSPMIAKTLLRSCDVMHLCELHPQEFNGLADTFKHSKNTYLYNADGYEQALALSPPMPRRGIIVIDPSYEIKQEYIDIPKFIAQIHKKWNVGTIVLWYPILPSQAHIQMVETLIMQDYPKTVCHEIMFETDLENHRLKGSGLFIINSPYGIEL